MFNHFTETSVFHGVHRAQCVLAGLTQCDKIMHWLLLFKLRGAFHSLQLVTNHKLQLNVDDHNSTQLQVISSVHFSYPYYHVLTYLWLINKTEIPVLLTLTTLNHELTLISPHAYSFKPKFILPTLKQSFKQQTSKFS